MEAGRKELLSTLRIIKNSDRENLPSTSWKKPILVVGVCLVLVFAWMLFLNADTNERGEQTLASSSSTISEQSTLATNNIATVAATLEASGYIVPTRMASLSIPFTGTVKQILVKEGDAVAAGDVLAVIDPGAQVFALDGLTAKVALAQIQHAEVAVELREARSVLAQTTALYTKNLESERIHSAVESRVELLELSLQRRDAEIIIAQSELAVQRRLIEDLTVRAPFDGIVIAQAAEVGEVLTPFSGDEIEAIAGIFTLMDPSSLVIEVEVNELNIKGVRLGQDASFYLDSDRDFEYAATVAAILPVVNRQKASVVVQLKFDTQSIAALPDMGVKVKFH